VNAGGGDGRPAELKAGAPGGIRTPNHKIRSLVLYVQAVGLSAVVELGSGAESGRTARVLFCAGW
jgi:hypothetical protein